jgi:hypothetical protein
MTSSPRSPLLRLAAALVLPAALGAARPAAADDTTPKATLRLEDFELLPLDDLRRQRLYLDNRSLVERLTILGKRAERVSQNLQGRANPEDEGSKKLLEELERLKGQVEPLLLEVERVLAADGIGPDVLARLADAPRGPHREERFAHRIVLGLESLTPEQRTVFARVVPAVEGAYFAMKAQEARLARPEGEGSADKAIVDRLHEALEAQRRAMERRFWRLVDYALTSEQRREVRRHLPTKLHRFENGIQHLFLLPGMTPSQGARLKALLIEIDSEAAPEGAEAKRLEAELADPSLPSDARAGKRAQLEAVQRRVLDLQLAAYRRGKEILTPEQFAEYEAIPPYVTAEDRNDALKGVVKGMLLSPAQLAMAKDLALRNAAKKREIEQGYRDVQRMKGETGPDSPQQTTMEMMGAAVASRAQAALREAGNELFLRILRPEQVEAWVLTLVGED